MRDNTKKEVIIVIKSIHIYQPHQGYIQFIMFLIMEYYHIDLVYIDKNYGHPYLS